MKKSILTLGAVVGIAAGAFAQGSLIMSDESAQGEAGINTLSSSPSAATGWYTGSMTLEVFTLAGGASAAQESAINGDSSSPAAALALLTSDGFVQQTIGGADSVSVNVTGGDFSDGTQTIGSSSTLASASTVTYALVGIIGSDEGVLALNVANGTVGAGTPAPGTPADADTLWPDQNLFVTAVPEPTVLALAGLGGLSLMMIRRRK